MQTITRLDLRKAIILEDARRITKGVKPINNVRKLARELENRYPKKYVADNLDKWLYHASSKGIKLKCRTYVMEEIIEDLCKLLHIDHDELVVEIELGV